MAPTWKGKNGEDGRVNHGQSVGLNKYAVAIEHLDRGQQSPHSFPTTWLLPALSLSRSSVAERLNGGEQWLEAGEYTTRKLYFFRLPFPVVVVPDVAAGPD